MTGRKLVVASRILIQMKMYTPNILSEILLKISRAIKQEKQIKDTLV